MHTNQRDVPAIPSVVASGPPLRSCPSRLKVVARAQAVLQEHADEPMTIGALSEAVGVSERTLRNAFTDVFSQSPKRYLVTQRLLAVRHALRAAATPGATVTGIATDHGFFELGRFALRYKAAFGESPSHTLRGTGRSAGLPQAS
jgi:transcriptional regulator GlxA family with amidase domain